jgi:hypothetical protein
LTEKALSGVRTPANWGLFSLPTCDPAGRPGRRLDFRAVTTQGAGQGWGSGLPPRAARRTLLGRLEALVNRDRSRLFMTVLVLATGVAGLLASVVLRTLGIADMGLRYGLSVGIAYATFIFLVWLWIRSKRRRYGDEPDRGEDGDPLEAADAIKGSLDEAASTGNDADLAGASGGADLDEGIVVVAVLLAIGAAVAASLYVVFIAPEFLAEMLLDGVLTTALYRRLRGLPRRHWFESAVSRTGIPVAIVAVFFVVAGVVCQEYAPEATSLVDVWRHWRAQ